MIIPLSAGAAVSEVAGVVSSVTTILSNIPGWNIFFGVAIVGAVAGLILAIVFRRG